MKSLVTIAFSLLSLASLAAVPPTGRYKTVVDRVQALHAAYPDLTHVFSIGGNDEGVEIVAIRVGLSPAATDPKRIGHLVVSTHHGNESATPTFTLRFLEDLLRRYRAAEDGSFSDWAKLADIEWTIVPVLNVSGYNASTRTEHAVDPNRDYPSPCTDHARPQLKSIQAVLRLAASRPFAGTVTVHGYDGSITYPWGMHSDTYRTYDHDRYDAIFQRAARENGYRAGNGAELIYPANGCFEDYVYWRHGSWSLLLELRDGSDPDITATVRAIASFFDQIDASPSNHNQFAGKCKAVPSRDLRIE